MKKLLNILFAFVFGLGLLACSQKEQIDTTNDIITFQMTPSLEGVEDFLKLLGDYSAGYGYDSDTCCNVTPEHIAEDYGFHIFKFDHSCSSFLLYENKTYPLGVFFGGAGVTSFAIADINGDDKQELYFTYSSGSGIHRSQVGYFDTANKEITIFDFQNLNSDVVLTVENNILCINDAACDIKSFVDIQLSAGSKLASIILDSNGKTIHTVNPQRAYSSHLPPPGSVSNSYIFPNAANILLLYSSTPS